MAGSTVVTCTATDSNGNSDMVSFTVTVLDETPPVITLNGDPEITIPAGSGPYVDPGATAVDNADGNIAVVIDSSAVDTNVPGTYTVIISATDNAGNSSQVTRTVVVQSGAQFLIIDQDSIDNGIQAIEAISFFAPFCGGGDPAVCVQVTKVIPCWNNFGNLHGDGSGRQ